MPKRKRTSKLPLKFILITLGTLILLGGGVFMARRYQESGIEQEGIVICDKDLCEKSLHIHAHIAASICGKQLDLNKHAGDTNQQHTHTEDDLMHFHNRLKVDLQNGQILDESPLYLGNFFANLGIRLTSECLADKCNGDICTGGQPGKLTMTVNGQDNQLFDQYPWQDGDIINLMFE